MIKFRLAAALALVLLLLATFTVTAIGESEVPPPYAGMKNPFPWDDATAQQAGKKVYQQSCLGCHGLKGDGLPGSNFAAASYSESLQNRPDYAYWFLSEGRLDKGMPPYKSSLSQEQRWQVLNYIWSLGKQAPAAALTAPAKPTTDQKMALQVTAPKEAQAGKSILLAAYLRDDQGKPVAGAPIKFFTKASFFSQGLMEIGDAVTNKDGTATLETALRQSGEVQVAARYESVEAVTTLALSGVDKPFYQTSIGIRMPSIGSELIVGPVITEGLGSMGRAPNSILRIPGGTLSWLLLLVLAVLAIWSTYFFVIYQVLHISSYGPTKSSNVRMLPYTLLVAVVVIGVFLALKLLTGPYSQFHLFS